MLGIQVAPNGLTENGLSMKFQYQVLKRQPTNDRHQPVLNCAEFWFERRSVVKEKTEENHPDRAIDRSPCSSWSSRLDMVSINRALLTELGAGFSIEPYRAMD